MRSLLAPAVVLALLTALPSCASGPPGGSIGDVFDGDWEETSAEAHPALRREARLVTWTRGRGFERETRRAIRHEGADHAIRTFEDLARHARPIASSEAAVAHLRLAHLLALLPGEPLQAAEGLDAVGGNGVYTAADARRWEVSLGPTVTPYAGGYRVGHAVVVPPEAHPSIPRKSTPWRVIWFESVVFPDAAVNALDMRSLLSGDAAARYASY